jgi:diguanylate cyclase (GGDEF)-like protein
MQFIADPPSRKQIRLVVAIAIIICAVTIAVAPFADQPGPVYPRLVLSYAVAEVMAYVSTAVLLLSQATILGNASRAVLGAAYLFAAIIFIPFVALIPEPYEPNGLLHGTWLLLFLDGGFALMTLLYVFRAKEGSRGPPSITSHIVGVLLFALAGYALIWVSVAQLPSVAPVDGDGPAIRDFVGPLVLLFNVAAMVALAVRLRARTPVDLWLQFMLLGDFAEIILTLLGQQRYTLGWNVARLVSLAGAMVLLLPVSKEITRLFRRLAEANRMLDQMANTDPLTGLPNRRRFDLQLSEEFRRARRTGAPIALILLDIDQFKRLNDKYGHPAGDGCLRRIAAVLSDTARRTGDTVARIGGEEFAIVLAASDLQQAAHVAEQIRVEVARLNIPNPDSDRGVVTVSAGVAALWVNSGLDDRWLIDTADRALYEAKAGGRDRIVMAAASTQMPRAAAA